MSIARPAAGQNSIEAAAFVLQFARSFNLQEIEQLFALEQQLAGDLPSFQKVSSLIVTASESSPSISQQQLAGVVLQKFQENGKPEWMLRAAGNQVVVSCHKYTAWAEVWARSRTWLLAAFKVVDSSTNGVMTTALQFRDRFVYDGNPADGKASDVFRTDSRFMTRQTWDSGPQWHVHQGWLVPNSESKIPALRVLNVVNITCAIQNNNRLEAAIDHIGEITFAAQVGLDSLTSTTPTGDLCGDCFSFLHDQNKQILRDTLSDGQLRAIGMQS